MKNVLFVVGFLLLGSHVQGGSPDAAPVPDLAKGGKKDDTPDWNLEPTGAKGWVFARGFDTSEARQILITEVEKGSPAKVLPAERRVFCASFRKALPPLPTRERRGHQTLAPAESWQGAMSLDNGWEIIELPELYPVFPFRIYGVGRPGLELARDTWAFSCLLRLPSRAPQMWSICWQNERVFRQVQL